MGELHQIWRNHHNAVDAWRQAGKPKEGPVFDAMKASLRPFKGYTPEEIEAALQEVRPSTTVDDLLLREAFQAQAALLRVRAEWRVAGRPKDGPLHARFNHALEVWGEGDELATEFTQVAFRLCSALEAKDHVHTFERGGACKHEGCQVRCPHPIFDGGICIECGCLKPLPGSPDFYELPRGSPQPCLLTSISPKGPDEGPDRTG